MVRGFPFMRLPLELRVVVYKELLVKPDPIDCPQHGYRHMPRWERDRQSEERVPPHEPYNLCLLRVSREIHAECGLLFYTHNTFQAGCLPALLHWLDDELSTRHRRAIARLIVYWDDVKPAATMQALHTCVGLRHLDLRFLELTPSRRGHHWMHFAGLNDLLKLRGMESLTASKDEGDPVLIGDCQGWEVLLQALQVVRQPRSRASLTRQYNKDFPPTQPGRPGTAGPMEVGGPGSVVGWPRVIGKDDPRHPDEVRRRDEALKMMEKCFGGKIGK